MKASAHIMFHNKIIIRQTQVKNIISLRQITNLAAGVLFVADEIVQQLVAERRALTDDKYDDDDDHDQSQVLLTLVSRQVATNW